LEIYLNMAAHERLAKSSVISQLLATVLPKDTNFKIYHLSTPPARTSSLYSAPPGTRPDRTYCESHFLSASIQLPSNGDASESLEVLVFAIEVLVYSTAFDTTFFVSKADSTGYLHLLNLPKGAPSPLREISGTFLRYLVEQRQRRNIKSIVSLFARAQDQYLFPGSIEYSGKHVLDDRGLVRWWCRVLNPLVEDTKTSPHPTSQWEGVKGYLIVPGLDLRETMTYIPRAAKSLWAIDHPLRQISRHADDVPPRCLIPHFPDDPKARYLDELDDEITNGENSASGQWKSVRSIDQFWDMMAFRQECSAGRLVGFIWIVFTPIVHTPPRQAESGVVDSQSTIATLDSQSWDTESSFPSGPDFLNSSFGPGTAPSSQITPMSSPLKATKARELPASQQSTSSSKPRTPRRKRLTGTVTARKPRVKTENRNYTLEIPESTAYYAWPPEGRGQVIVDESDYKRATELLLRLDFANLELASSSSTRWINEVRSGAWGSMSDAWGQTVTGTKAVETPTVAADFGVATLNMGLVKKKRKAGAEEKIEPSADAETSGTVPQPNILVAGMVRKKAKG
jgi:regulator of Ty1 transposition protein 109